MAPHMQPQLQAIDMPAEHLCHCILLSIPIFTEANTHIPEKPLHGVFHPLHYGIYPHTVILSCRSPVAVHMCGDFLLPCSWLRRCFKTVT